MLMHHLFVDASWFISNSLTFRHFVSEYCIFFASDGFQSSRYCVNHSFFAVLAPVMRSISTQRQITDAVGRWSVADCLFQDSTAHALAY